MVVYKGGCVGYFVVDVEANGPCPGLYSMIEIGAVLVSTDLKETFHGKLRPIVYRHDPEALNAIGIKHEDTLGYDDPKVVMHDFYDWVGSTNRNGRSIFVSDNLAFDWQFINYYFHMCSLPNPFGYSGRRIGDIYAGVVKDMRSNWKHLRVTKHTHNPVDDAMGNAEALIKIAGMGVNGIL